MMLEHRIIFGDAVTVEIARAALFLPVFTGRDSRELAGVAGRRLVDIAQDHGADPLGLEEVFGTNIRILKSEERLQLFFANDCTTVSVSGADLTLYRSHFSEASEPTMGGGTEMAEAPAAADGSGVETEEVVQVCQSTVAPLASTTLCDTPLALVLSY